VNEVVVDASVAIAALTGVAPPDRELRSRLAGSVCHAPHLVDAEVGSVLRRRLATGDISATVAESALHAVLLLIDQRYPHGSLADGAWALRANLSYYDALYVALAARLQVPLLTLDARLSRSPQLPCAVELLA
jgi:predicted nucleic acid-binding protein